MLQTLLTEGFTTDVLFDLAATLIVLFLSLPVHEAAHAWVAYKLGDNTAKSVGRLTLNPFKHLDLIGSLMIFFVGFGWAKPVPVITRNFKKIKRDMALTALAGPVSNLIMAFICIVFSRLVLLIPITSFESVTFSVVYMFVQLFAYAAVINLSLAVFNFIPFPPLDGSRILNALLPYKAYYKLMEYERYFQIALLIILFTPILTGPLSSLVNIIYEGMYWVVDSVFLFFA